MEGMLVYWPIRKGYEEHFLNSWKAMKVQPGCGLIHEFLMQIDEEVVDPRFRTLSLGDPNYSTFLNVGIWESIAHFENAVGRYIPEQCIVQREGRSVYSIELEPYEFKLRERIALKVVSDRGGQLPAPQLAE